MLKLTKPSSDRSPDAEVPKSGHDHRGDKLETEPHQSSVPSCQVDQVAGEPHNARPIKDGLESIGKSPAPNLEKPKLRSGKLQILVVDDDAGLRRFVSTVLNSAGFEVFEAADGNAAVQMCEQIETIDLVLADVLMPKLSGRQLASHVVTHHPEAKILLMSGYPNVSGFLDGVIGRAEKTKTEYGFIRKPFGPAELVRTISDLLKTE